MRGYIMGKLPQRIIVSLTLILAVLILVACSSKTDITGTWRDANGNLLQFYKDGTVTSSSAVVSLNGVYTFPDNKHIKIEIQGLLGLAGPQIYEYKFVNGKLILNDNLGNETEFTKVNDSAVIGNKNGQGNTEVKNPTQAAPKPTEATLVKKGDLTFVLYGLKEDDDSEAGWKVALVNLCLINNTDKALPMESINITNIYIETSEGKKYPAYLTFKDTFGSYVLRSPEYRQEFPVKVDPYNEGQVIPSGLQYKFPNLIAFNFSNAAHPTRLVIISDEYGEIALDLTNVEANIPAINESGMNIKPFSEFNNDLNIESENSKISLSFGNNLILEGPFSTSQSLYLPFTLINNDTLDNQSIDLKFTYAIYEGDGNYMVGTLAKTLSGGPGQTVNDHVELSNYNGETDPDPQYFIYYPENQSPIVYKIQK